MKKLLFLASILFFLGACDGNSTAPSVIGNVGSTTARDLQIVTGQMLYVPAYSEIFYGSTDQTMALSVTLTIHNTDFDNPIFVQSVRYYNTDGELVTEYVPETVEVSPLATIGFVVPDDDLTGGWGANFIVEWVAENPVHEPIVEAIMVSTRGTQGISMISSGRILSQTGPDDS